MVQYPKNEKLLGRKDLEVFVWTVADSYRIEKGTMDVEEVGDGTMTHPLADPELFPSFARLGAKGEPSQSKILGWVEEHGLLQREDENLPRIYRKRVNQSSISVTNFRKEVKRANSATHLYHGLFTGGPEVLKARISTLREQQSSPTARPLAEIDQWLVENWNEEEYETGYGLVHPSFRAYAMLRGLVTRRISQVRLSFFEEEDMLGGPAKGYKPAQSWDCPDLLSAIWLQFYLAMTGTSAMKVCENPACRTPFPAPRKDKRFCTDTCRSNARHYR